MVEMMGYLMVMMSVIVAIGKIVSSAFNNHRYSTATMQVTDLATSMVKAAALDVDYTFVIEDVNGDNKMKIIPPNFRKVGKKLFHVFGGEVKIEESPNYDPDCCEEMGYCDEKCKRKDQFSITYAGLNKKQCIELAMKNWTKNQYVDLYAVYINDIGWFWLAYGDSKGKGDELTQLDSGECGKDADGKTICAFPMKRSILTGTGGDSVGQCAESGNNITWVFN